MAIRAFLQSLGATHLFTLDNEGTAVSDDLGDSVDPTRIRDGSYSFVTNPVCEGVTHSLQATNSNDVTTRTDGARLDNRNDIHGGNGAGNDSSVFNYVNNNRTVHLWFKQPVIDTPTCIYEQGGGTNNFAFIVGTAKAITWQAADSGQPFLIAQSKFLADVNRAYFVLGVWEHHSNHAGSGNRILFYINGVLQEIIEGSGTDDFPSHSGDICIGNTAESLKSYNEDSVPFSTRTKYVNMLGMYNNVSLSEAQSREIFERTVIPEVTISADTVVNQQAALDALIGNSYAGINCAIRIVQATDATDYRLFIDNINFQQDANLKDIAIQYVGSNTLTIENTNESNVVEISTPQEVDLDGTTILTGGGTLTTIEGTTRIHTVTDQLNVSATKLVIEQAGDYVFTNVNISEFENVSGGVVNITTDKEIPLVTNTGVGSTTNLIDAFLSFEGISNWIVYSSNSDRDLNTNPLGSGASTDVFRFSYTGNVTYYLRLSVGAQIVFSSSTPSNAGETIVTLETISLLLAIRSENKSDHEIINNEITNVKAKTDLLNFTGTDVKATLDNEEVVTDSASREASKADVANLRSNQDIINEGVEKASLFIPHKTNVN